MTQNGREGHIKSRMFIDNLYLLKNETKPFNSD